MYSIENGIRGGITMSKKNVTIYVSEDCHQCGDLITQLDEWNISYHVKNVTKNRRHLEELQDIGVFGTPATVVDEEIILGFPRGILQRVFNIYDG